MEDGYRPPAWKVALSIVFLLVVAVVVAVGSVWLVA